LVITREMGGNRGSGGLMALLPMAILFLSTSGILSGSIRTGTPPEQRGLKFGNFKELDVTMCRPHCDCHCLNRAIGRCCRRLLQGVMARIGREAAWPLAKPPGIRGRDGTLIHTGKHLSRSRTGKVLEVPFSCTVPDNSEPCRTGHICLE
jgi:hypothetical protein